MYDTRLVTAPGSITGSRRQVAILPVVFALFLGISLGGCHDLTGTQGLPAGTQDPSFYDNATGALGMRNSAVAGFGAGLPSYVVATGLLTDELTDLSTITNTAGTSVANNGHITDPLDERILPELSYGATESYNLENAVYDQLQGVRTALLQAIGQLAAYDTSAKDRAILAPAADSVLRGELYALYGYAEIQLADLFCSGVPLSTLDFQKDFTYRAGSTTAQIYQDAIGKLDTALTLASTSDSVVNLARVGLGRAYLDLAFTNPAYVAAAADDVSTVPSEYQYQVIVEWASNDGTTFTDVINQVGTVSNAEGSTGQPYLSSGDPRTADTTVTIYNSNVAVGFPRTYVAALSGTSYAPITVASGIEARLIQAEAALRTGNVQGWLALLNQLRETAPIPGTTQPQPSLLPDLSDPGTGSTNPDSARVALTFTERAAWLYMTGHRQGDLRRQLRQYGRYWPDESLLYPSGTYLGLGAGQYGTDVTAPIPAAEYINPLFHGCLTRVP